MNTAPDGRILSPGEVYEPTEPQELQEEEWRQDLNITLMCLDCQELPPNLVEEFSSGDTVCGSCGRVLAEKLIDTRSEWRTFSNDNENHDDPSRVGDAANPLLHGSQLSTEIAFDGTSRTNDLARIQSRSSQSKVNRNLQAAYGKIQILCDTANISKVAADTSKYLYMKVIDSGMFKRKPQDAIIAGCLIVATRMDKNPRSFNEIQRLTKLSRSVIGRTFKKLEPFLYKIMAKDKDHMAGAGAVWNTSAIGEIMAAEAKNLIPRACSKLGLSTQTTMIAEKAAENVSKAGIGAGRSPLSIMGACIYFVSNLMAEPCNLKHISGVVHMAENTIKTAYKEIYESLEKVIEESWLQKGGDLAMLPQV